MKTVLKSALWASCARRVYPLLAVLACAGLWPAQAMAQVTASIAPRQVTVAPNVGRVSYSEAYQKTFVGYRVTLKGGKSTSTLQSFIVELTNTADIGRPNFELNELGQLLALNASCTPSAVTNKLTLTCVPVAGKTVSIRAGQSLFVDLYYTSAGRLSTSPALGNCSTPTGCLTMNASTDYTVGTTKSTSKAVPSKLAMGVYSLIGRNQDTTGAVVTSSPRSSVREFFTGTSKSPSSNDVFTTTVIVPPEAGSTSVSVVESLIPKSNASCVHFLSYCYQSAITVPPPNGVSFAPQYLTIELRADPSNVIVPAGSTLSAVQGTVTLQYQPDGSTSWVSIASCPAPNTPLPAVVTSAGATVYYPCLNSSTIDANGDLVWQFISFKNGGFKML